MKQALALSLMVFAAPVMANNWAPYAQTGDADQYYDRFRRVVMSGMAFVWDLHNLKTAAADASGKPYQSVLYPSEYNCRMQQRRILSVHRMTGPMGEGVAVSEDQVVGKWMDVLPDSPESRLMKAACESD